MAGRWNLSALKLEKINEKDNRRRRDPMRTNRNGRWSGHTMTHEFTHPDEAGPDHVGWVTADGDLVEEIYCTNAPGSFPIHGRTKNRETPVCWKPDGNSPILGLRLFDAEPAHEYRHLARLALLDDGSVHIVPKQPWNTEERTVVAIKDITITEGEGM